MKHFKFITHFIIAVCSILFSSLSITNGSGTREMATIDAAEKRQSLRIAHTIEEAMSVFSALGEADALSAANHIVQRPSGFISANHFMASFINTEVTSINPVRLTDNIVKRDETKLRIFIELCFYAGLHTAESINPEMFEDIQKKTKRFLEELGDVSGHRVGVTIRGNVSVAEDKVPAIAIVKSYLSKTTTQGISPEKLTSDSMEVVERLLENKATYLGFARLGQNTAARKMYIALCAKVFLSNQSLTESGCAGNAQLALAAFGR